MTNMSASLQGAMRLLDRQIFTSNGTWTKPADAAGNIAGGVGKIVKVKLIAPGGGGAKANGTGFSQGGGGGGRTDKTFAIDEVSATEAVTIGAAGLGATSSGTVGGDGGDVSFGARARAGGGKGGGHTGGSVLPKVLGGEGTTPGGDAPAVVGSAYDLSTTYPVRGTSAGGSAASSAPARDSAAAAGGTYSGTSTAATAGGSASGYEEGAGGGGNGSTGNGGAGGNYGGGGGATLGTGNGGNGGAGVCVVEVWG